MRIPKSNESKLILPKHSLLAGAFLLLVIFGAKINIKVAAPVSFTLQTLFIGLAYNYLPFWWRSGLIICYLILGVAGLPVFSGGIGWHYFVSIPLGFFIGFVIGVILPWQSKTSSISPLYNFLIFHGVVVCCGVFWVGFHLESASMALDMGVELLPGALLKSILGAVIVWFIGQVET